MLRWLKDFRFAAVLILAVVLAATVQKYTLGAEQYNNFLIFRASFGHLVSNLNLYAPFPSEHLDLFKYSPTFAFCTLPLAFMPLWAGTLVWNLLNAGVFIAGIWVIGGVTIHGVAVQEQQESQSRITAIMLWICAVELLTSTQNFQSNALVAGFAMLAVGAWEREKAWQAALFLALSFHIKIYGLAPIALMVLYPRKGRFLLGFSAWLLVLTALPLLIISPENLLWQYANWRELLRSDHAASYGASVMSILAPLLPTVRSVSALQAASLVVQCAPLAWLLLRRKSPEPLKRLLLLASMLLWMVIFNHKAESPTFVIAVAGVALWYGMQPTSSTWLRYGLLWFVLVGTSFSVTDLFSPSLRDSIFVPMNLKVLPCIAVWCAIQWQIWRLLVNDSPSNFATGTHFDG